MIKKGDWVQIQSYKHDGSLHRCWDQGLVLEVNDDYVVIASRRTKVTEADGRRWFTREPAITIFSLKEWYNVIAMIKSDGISYYCNIASPSLVDNDIVKYIDYDLDLKLYPDGVIKILDENEYERHRQRYDYSQDLDTVLNKEVTIIEKKMKEGNYPFDNQKINDYYQDFLNDFEEQHK